MKRVLLLTSSYPLHPNETFNAGILARDLAVGLQKKGHEVLVVTPQKDRPIQDPEVSVQTFPWWGNYRELAPQRPHFLNLFRFITLLLGGTVCVDRILSRFRAEFCLALWAIPSGIFAYWVWQRYKVPYGVWALGSDIWGRKRYPFGEQVVRQVLQKANFCLADGWHLAREAERIACRRCAFLPSIRRLPLLQIQTVPLAPARCHLLYLGRFEYQKGIDVFVEALCRLHQQHLLDNIHVHLLGDGTLRPWVEHRLQSQRLSDKVILYGYAPPDTVVSMMRSVDYLVIPSRIESIPLAFWDAVQCELPVIVTDVGDLGMLVRNKQVGWVVEEPSVTALISGLQHVLAHPEYRSQFCSNIRVLKELFYPERMVDAIDNLLKGRGYVENISAELLGSLGNL